MCSPYRTAVPCDTTDFPQLRLTRITTRTNYRRVVTILLLEPLTLCPFCPLCVVSALCSSCPLCQLCPVCLRCVHCVLHVVSVLSVVSIVSALSVVTGASNVFMVSFAPTLRPYLLRPSCIYCLHWARCNLDVVSVVCSVVCGVSILSVVCPLRPLCPRRVRYD